jgi:pimeloyl-ACP methyl ester carboxylesterase
MLARILADGEANPPMRRLGTLAIAFLLGCLAGARAPEPPIAQLPWRNCGGGFQCSALRVPVDHLEPVGPTVELAIVRLPAAKPEARLGALLVNPGGPGISAIAYLRSSWARLGAVVHERFDLVAFDTRGTGDSAALDCHQSLPRLLDQDPAPVSDDAWRALVDASRAFAEECAQKHGGLLPFMSSADNARDMDWVRKALGEAQISYLGFSYGTSLGNSYASLFPDRLRALVLDGSIDPSHDLERFTREQSAAVESALVAWDSRDRHRGGHGADALDRIYASASRKSTVLYAAAEGLATPPGGWQELGAALGDAEGGDWAGIGALSDSYFGGLSVEAQLATLCADLGPLSVDGFRAARPAADAASAHFGSGNLLSHLPCAFWVPARTQTPADVARAGAPPILVIANSKDPLTPHVWGERLAQRFASATRVDVESSEHTAFARGDACVDALVRDYLVAPAPPARTHCP